MSKVISVANLSKTFLVKRSLPGVWGSLKGLFIADAMEMVAIDQISFGIHGGERVAFVGPNGAGKSTTIKMLTGILHPTAGSVTVLGRVPWEDQKSLGFEIGAVFGQRSQLWYHLPPSDTFDLLSKIYELDRKVYRERLNELVDIFEIGGFLHKLVRQLSLGQRMRCELVASLLHRPQILFLDEPTIGLDINAKLKIRDLLNRLSKQFGTTLFLTSHDTADIEQVCDRVIVLNKGKIISDSSLKELKKNCIKKKILTLTTDAKNLSLQLPGVQVLEKSDHVIVCEVDLKQSAVDQVIHEVLKVAGIKDMTVEDPSMEEIIRTLYG